MATQSWVLLFEDATRMAGQLGGGGLACRQSINVPKELIVPTSLCDF